MKRIVALAALAFVTALSPAPAAAGSALSLPAPVINDRLWRPTPHMRWQLQYSTQPVDLSVEADVYKIDLFDNDASDVSDLKSKGKNAVCYVNVGAWENWRPDARDFPRAAMGRH